MMDKAEILQLAQNYERSADRLHDALRDYIREAGGFLNTANNMGRKKNLTALVYDKGKKSYYSVPVEALRVSEEGEVEVFLGNETSIYTDKFLRTDRSGEHWRPVRGSEVLFLQTVLSIAERIDDYL